MTVLDDKILFEVKVKDTDSRIVLPENVERAPADVQNVVLSVGPDVKDIKPGDVLHIPPFAEVLRLPERRMLIKRGEVYAIN